MPQCQACRTSHTFHCFDQHPTRFVKTCSLLFVSMLLLVQEVLWAAKVPFEDQQGGGWSSVDRRAWQGLQISVALRLALLRDQSKPVRTENSKLPSRAPHMEPSPDGFNMSTLCFLTDASWCHH